MLTYLTLDKMLIKSLIIHSVRITVFSQLMWNTGILYDNNIVYMFFYIIYSYELSSAQNVLNVYLYYCKDLSNNTELHIPITFKMTHHALKRAWQHTLIFVIEFFKMIFAATMLEVF